MMADNDQDTLTLLRKFDRMITSNNTTVADLIEQAVVASEIADERLYDIGPLELMYTELRETKSQVETLTLLIKSYSTYGMGEQNPYQNITWSDNTSGWTGSPQMDPTRNYPPGYVWNPLMGKVTLAGS